MRYVPLLFALTLNQASAAGINMEAFDRVHCQSWWVSDELGFDLDPLPEVLKVALANAQRSPSSTPQRQRAVLRGFMYLKSRGSNEKGDVVGDVVCFGDQHMTCLSTLSGSQEVRKYEFTLTSSPNSRRPPTLSCKAPCGNQSVTALYGLPWEDGPKNLEYGREHQKFARRCG
jgi:hypothetical protein